jgi:hypothetical protein
MTRKKALEKITDKLSIRWHEDKIPKCESDVAVLVAMKALENMIYLEEQMGVKDIEIEV